MFFFMKRRFARASPIFQAVVANWDHNIPKADRGQEKGEA